MKARQNMGVVWRGFAILAGLGLEREPESEEAKYYFEKSVNDLGLELPSEENSISSYAKYICHEIVNGSISPSRGLSILEGLYSKTEYQPIYSIWDDLREDMWMANDREACMFNTGLTKENIDQYIIKVASQFIELSEIELLERFFHLSACQECGYIGEHKFDRIDLPWLPEKLFRYIYTRGLVWRAVCSRCGEPFPLSMGDYVGREQYLKSKC